MTTAPMEIRRSRMRRTSRSRNKWSSGPRDDNDNNGGDGMIKNYLLEQQPFPSETEVYELLSLIV